MLVTVYMPTKDRVELLARAVDSVLTQTYHNIELIIVNDGSTDSTADYLKNKVKQDSRLVYFSNTPAKGAPAARNLAIRAAKGTFITGLDDDDEFLPQRVATFVEYWQLLEVSGVKPSCLYSQDIWTIKNSPVYVTKKRSSVSISDMFECNCIGNQIFAPKQHFIEAGLFNENLPAWQDLEFFMRVLSIFGTARLLDCATYIFDNTPRGDRISLKSENKIREAFEIVASSHAVSARDTQELLLQVFSEFYRLRPNLSDWLRFLKLGFSFDGLRQMKRAMRY